MSAGKGSSESHKDTERNFWMGAEDAVKYGLAAKVITHANEI